jgi:hypothetical protein
VYIFASTRADLAPGHRRAPGNRSGGVVKLIVAIAEPTMPPLRARTAYALPDSRSAGLQRKRGLTSIIPARAGSVASPVVRPRTRNIKYMNPMLKVQSVNFRRRCENRQAIACDRHLAYGSELSSRATIVSSHHRISAHRIRFPGKYCSGFSDGRQRLILVRKSHRRGGQKGWRRWTGHGLGGGRG